MLTWHWIHILRVSQNLCSITLEILTGLGLSSHYMMLKSLLLHGLIIVMHFLLAYQQNILNDYNTSRIQQQVFSPLLSHVSMLLVCFDLFLVFCFGRRDLVYFSLGTPQWPLRDSNVLYFFWISLHKVAGSILNGINNCPRKSYTKLK